MFCQRAVSRNYGLHRRFEALSLCLLTLCSTVLDKKHECLAWAPRKYCHYASRSEYDRCWDPKHTNACRSQNIPNVMWCTCYSVCIVAVITHVVGVCCCMALDQATEALQLHHRYPSNRVRHHHGRPIKTVDE